MPTDLTGTPTSLGIGTYNVDADAPSGLGFNAAMAQIDALIASRLTTPAGILAGEIPVWNGSTWVRSSTLGMAASGISGYPNSVAKFLRGDGAWGTPGLYRKVTAKQVVNSIAETDLLNGEITVGAGVLGTTGVLRLTAWGDAVNNSGAGQNFPRFKAKLGATTLIDSGVVNQWLSSAARFMWRVSLEVMNLNAANSQWSTLIQDLGGPSIGATAAVGATTGEGNNNVQVTINQGRIVEANSTAVDTTASQVLAYTVTLPVANAALDWTLKGALVEVV